MAGLAALPAPSRFVVPRTLIGAPLAVLALIIWLGRATYRGYEAVVAGAFSGLATGSHEFTLRSRSTFFVNAGTPKVFGVAVTPECTSALVTAAFLIVTGVVISTTRLDVRRVMVAGAAAAGLFLIANIARLVLIAFASDHWGLISGYHWSHVWAGTFVTVFGITLAVALFLVVLGGGRSAFRRAADPVVRDGR